MARDYTLLRDINVDKVARQLEIDARGRADGKSETPDSSALRPNAFERQIAEAVGAHFRKVRADVERDRATRRKTLQSHKSKLMSATVVPEARKSFQGLELQISNEKRNLYRVRKELEGEEKALHDFTRPRGIVDFPPKTDPFVTACLLVILIVFEAFANMYFFAEGNELGYLGAVLTAMGISAINVLGGFAVGLAVMRQVNRKSVGAKVLGGVTTLACILGLLGFHFSAALYRQVREAAPDIDVANASIAVKSQLWPPNLAGLDLLSMLMLILGLVFGLFAIFKGYTYGHPYPGYAKRYYKMRSAEQKFVGMTHDFKDDFMEGAERILDDLRDAIAADEDHASRYEALYKDITSFEGRFATFQQDMQASATELISRYRRTNVEARETPAPAYFEDQPVIGDLTAMEAEPLPAIENLSRATGNHATFARELLEEVNDFHKDLKDFLSDIDSAKTTAKAEP